MDILAIVAHPDDLEIGAGGLVARLAESAGRIWEVVVTDEFDPTVRERRRLEAVEAAAVLGSGRDIEVSFLRQRDQQATCSGAAVQQLRAEMLARRFTPDLVVTHTRHDRHQDHRAVHDLAVGSTADAPVHFFMGVVNSVNQSRFSPTIFVDTTAWVDHKLKALRCHRSQEERGRILYGELASVEAGYGRRLGCQRAEGFEWRCNDQDQARSLLTGFASERFTGDGSTGIPAPHLP